jgi:di/tricarboxylate transporter
MTAPQILTFAVLGGTMLLFVWGRFRYDLVAILSLLAALATGIVTPARAFSGFSDEIVIIVGSALVVSAAIERSGVIEALVARATANMQRLGAQIAVLAARSLCSRRLPLRRLCPAWRAAIPDRAPHRRAMILAVWPLH